MKAVRELGRILRREGGYGEVHFLVWALLALAVLLFIVPWLFHAASAAFGWLGGLILVIAILLLIF